MLYAAGGSDVFTMQRQEPIDMLSMSVTSATRPLVAISVNRRSRQRPVSADVPSVATVAGKCFEDKPRSQKQRVGL